MSNPVGNVVELLVGSGLVLPSTRGVGLGGRVEGVPPDVVGRVDEVSRLLVCRDLMNVNVDKVGDRLMGCRSVNVGEPGERHTARGHCAKLGYFQAAV